MIDSLQDERADIPDDRQEWFLSEFTRERDHIFAYIFSLLPHRNDAEDVFQRTSLILWRKFDDFQPDGRFLSWACGVAFYEVRNFQRVANRDRMQFRDELIKQLADERAATLKHRDERLVALERCAQKLNQRDRELVDAVYFHKQPIKALAESTGRAAQTLYNRINLIRRQLMECVERTTTAVGEVQ